MGVFCNDCNFPTFSRVILTFIACVLHGIALIFHYWTDYDKLCEIDSLKRNQTCRVQQGLWQYCEKYKKLDIQLCSYEHLDSWVRVVAIFSCLGIVSIFSALLGDISQMSCRVWKDKLPRYIFLSSLLAVIWITSGVIIYSVKSETKKFDICFYCGIAAAILSCAVTVFYLINWRRNKRDSVMEPLLEPKQSL